MTATETASGIADALGRAVQRILSEVSCAPGLTVAVTDRENVLADQAYGLADVAAQRPTNTSTLFEIGSISKGFTAALLLQARDRGLLDLDEPVTTYLPWFKVQSRFDPITIRHLLTHTAGIIRGPEFTGEAAFDVWTLRDTPATVPPGTWHYYSNTGYKALGLVIQTVYQRPYEQVLAAQLLRPLEMAASEPAITHDTRRRLAVGYERFYDDRPMRRADGLAPANWVETATADGSIAATSADMTNWLRMLMRDGVGPNDEQVVQAHSVQEMLTGAIADEDEPGSLYGLGMSVGEIDGHRVISHTGGMIGYHAAVACDQELGLGAVVLANGEGPWDRLARHAITVANAARNGAAAPEIVLAADTTQQGAPADIVTEVAPNELAPFVGHYRCFNPWLSNIRVQFHGDKLWLWAGENSTSLGEPLAQVDDGSFRVGADERSPERVRFDVVIDGKAVRATLSGAPLYRTFTP